VGVLAFGAYWAIRLQANLTTASLGAGNTKSEGSVSDSTDRMQILVLGSDTRDGKNSQYGGVDDSTGYGHSDVMMLLDISADNTRVNVISFPRDLLVDIPKCKDPKTGTEYPAHTNMINAAMSEAGIGCAVDTVNKLTGMETDHFMMADFNAVKELSNAVGGVDVCISDAVYDPDSRLRLPQGTSTVQGEQALSFVRTRHAFGDGGDLGRIQAQQAFLSSLTRKIKDDGTFSNPARMLGIADAITKNLTIDDGLASIPTLLTVGNRLKNIDVGKVAFVAVPTVPAEFDPNRLQLAEPAASQLFAAMRKNIDLTDPTAEPDASAVPGASASAEPTAAPAAPAYDKSLQPVTVANGSGVLARTQEILQALAAGGFTQLDQLSARPVATTAVYYGPGFADVAADVAALLGVPAAQVLPVAGVAGVQVYLGTDFAAGVPAATAGGQVQLPSDIVNQTAGDTVCQQANPALIVAG
jgi:LCP family protein required for cell wall assembly